MRLLVDRDFNANLRGPDPIATGIPEPLDNGLGRKSQVQAASITFTVGDIFIPGTEPDDLGGSKNPRTKYELRQGHTAVVRTREDVHLGRRQAAIGFPPSFLSLRGLLMTNPGHIDPGYNGPLHCTVINMARGSFHLQRGDHVMRVLVFELGPQELAPEALFDARQRIVPNRTGQSPIITEELLDGLSIDFVDVEKRAGDAAEKQVTKAQLAASRVPLITAFLTGVLTLAGSYFLNSLTLKDEVAKLRNELALTKSSLEAADKLNKLTTDLANLSASTKIDERIRRIEESLNVMPSATQQRRPP